MKFKEILEQIIKIYTRVVTGIFLFMCFNAFFFSDNFSIGVKDIIGVHIIGLVCAIIYIPLYLKSIASKILWLIMNIFYFLSINVTVFIVAYILKWADFEYKLTIVVFEGMIVGIYALMMFIAYRIDSNQANKLNLKLKERNKDL